MTGNEALLTFALIAGGFLLGGVMFSRALPKLLTGKDVCALRADKNPGAANVFAVCGVPMGLLCLALDMLKAYLPVSLAAQYLDTQSVWFALALAAPVLGAMPSAYLTAFTAANASLRPSARCSRSRSRAFLSQGFSFSRGFTFSSPSP